MQVELFLDTLCKSCGEPIPALGIAVCSACREDGACTVCGQAHRPTQCPDVVRARLEMVEAERLAHTRYVSDWASRLLDKYAARPIWEEAA